MGVGSRVNANENANEEMRSEEVEKKKKKNSPLNDYLKRNSLAEWEGPSESVCVGGCICGPANK